MLVLGFPDYDQPAQGLAKQLGAPYQQVGLHAFPDGESRVQLPNRLPPHVVLCRSLDRPNTKLVELLLTARTARELGARRLSLVAPYLCYMRQDTAFHPGEAVSQHIVGAFLAQLFDDLVTVDPHLHRVSHIEDAVPCRRALSLTAAPLLGQHLADRLDNPLLLGPDEESEQWVRAVAEVGGFDFGVARKERHADSRVTVTLPALDVQGREVVLVDDLVSTGGTVATAAQALLAAGARSVHVAVTHALFAEQADERIRAAGVTKIISTDSIRHPSNEIPLAPLLAQAVKQL